MNEEEIIETGSESEDVFELDPTDFGEETVEENQLTEETTEQQESEGTEEPATEETPASEPKSEEELFEVTFLGDKKSLTREELTAYAQQGMNYGRVEQQRNDYRQQVEELTSYKNGVSESIELLESAAKTAGMAIPEFLNSLRENMLVSQGLTREAAKERIERENAEKKLAQFREKEQKAAEKQKADRAEIERQNKDIQEFMQHYPKVNPKELPQEVWNKVFAGESMVNAYSDYLDRSEMKAENEKLKARLAALEKNNQNREAATGSVKSAGKSTEEEDDFLRGFNDI